MTLIGGLAAIVGAIEPWTVAQPDYCVTDLPRIAIATDIVEKTQPSVRLAMIVPAVAMIIGVVGKGGKQTMSSAASNVAGMIAYLVFLSSKVITSGPMLRGRCGGWWRHPRLLRRVVSETLTMRLWQRIRMLASAPAHALKTVRRQQPAQLAVFLLDRRCDMRGSDC